MYKGFAAKAFKPIVSKDLELADIMEAHRYRRDRYEITRTSAPH